MQALSRHGRRVLVSLLPLVFAVLHVAGLMPLEFLQRLDHIIYDARLRWTMPASLDDRVVIVDIDEQSLAEEGQWPWPRDRLALLVDTLFDHYGVSQLGFDTVFAEADSSSGLPVLERMADQALKDQADFQRALEHLRPQLDNDQRLADSLRGRPVALGYYFSSDIAGRTSGQLPAPVFRQAELGGRVVRGPEWTGYGANLPVLAASAPIAGFFNSVPDRDGVVRSLPMLVAYRGAFYESLSLAMFRQWLGSKSVEPGFPSERVVGRDYGALESLVVRRGDSEFRIPVDEQLAALIPFRGPGGPQGSSFRYVSASDVLGEKAPVDVLKGRIVLVGATAPGLHDLRATPVGEAYPGVETHANLIAGWMDGRKIVVPDYAAGYELVVLLLAGGTLVLGLSLLSAAGAVLLSGAVIAVVIGTNAWLFLAHGLALPMAGLVFALNMSYGYLVESRAKRELAQLFGTYVPPELVDEMVKDPDSYSMAATTRELTVMFCDMRGFTSLAETMSPTQLQELLNTVFSRLTRVVRRYRGTIDKYMGDCVMAFWGAPVEEVDHAKLAVCAALDMAEEIRNLNGERRRAGLPDIGIGIGLNTGDMCVGDMGSDVRRSYTVVGDAVNLGSRLEGLSQRYGVDIVASESTRRQTPGFEWQELDLVRVKGKAQAVAIHTPLGLRGSLATSADEELSAWRKALTAWRTRDWEGCDTLLRDLRAQNAKKVLYRLYAERVASIKLEPLPPDWDGSTTFESK
ncbi:MAG: adenylate/guanylate cyclase domain-containing protein [Hydrogenophaga sp.]|nr:adenylate/guanylate cyclase domain-containing protein [Hydrogenophaga sp.]